VTSQPPPPPPPFEDGDALTDEERVALDATAERARAGSDADLWAFVFDGPLRAQEALLAAMRLVGRSQLKLEDAAVVTRVGGRVRIQQTRDVTPSQGALGGVWLGTFAGLLVAQPILGAALGAAAGGLFGKLRDHGIDDGEMKRLGDELSEGEAALFLLVEDCHQLRAMHEVSRFPARLLMTTADPALADEVRDRLAVDPWG
jgi:uncharacterized membrane protein